ncbi:MAG: hypothetical protein M1420_01415 [Actinobacteria bacterium]|jgi:hypothetical protein|nr:hypothetical protein [Actinomycetota bacterium]
MRGQIAGLELGGIVNREGRAADGLTRAESEKRSAQESLGSLERERRADADQP